MSEITVDIQSLTDEELSDALRIRGAQYGPIGPSTRAVYENKLRKLLMGSTSPAPEPMESGGQGESSPGRSKRSTRQSKPASDDDEEDASSTRPQIGSYYGQQSNTPVKSSVTKDPPRRHSPERVPYSSIQSEASRYPSYVSPVGSSASQMTRRPVFSELQQPMTKINPRSERYATQPQTQNVKGGWMATAIQLLVFIVIAVALVFVLLNIDFLSQPAGSANIEQQPAAAAGR